MGFNMSDTPFDENDVTAWYEMFVDNRPNLPTIAEAVVAVDVFSLTALARRTGVCVRMRTSDGNDITLNFNAVSASQMHAMILQAGLICGWMGIEGSIIIPPSPG